MILTHGANSLNRGGGGKYVPTEYVQIGSLLWTIKNLDLDLGTEGVNQLTHTWPGAGKLYTLGLLLDTLQLGDGWRIPTSPDFLALNDYASYHGSSANVFQKLATTDNTYNSYHNGTDEFRFNALIAGFANKNESVISNLGRSVNFWTTTVYSGNYYRDWCLENGYKFAPMYHHKNNLMLCVRLCKDAT